MSRPRPAALLAAIGLLFPFGAAACSGQSSSPQATVSAFLAAWNRSDWPAVYKLMAEPPAPEDSPRTILAGVPLSGVSRNVGTLSKQGSTASVPLNSTYTLPGGIGSWQVASTINLIDILEEAGAVKRVLAGVFLGFRERELVSGRARAPLDSESVSGMGGRSRPATVWPPVGGALRARW